MISINVLKQLERIAKPGITIHYTELNNVADKNTVSDPKNELSKAIKNNNNIGDIVFAIYKNTPYKNSVVIEPSGKIHIVDKNQTTKYFKITKSNTTLKIYDPVNNKTTIIEHSIADNKKEVKKSLQEQILEELKKKKMTDKQVLDFIKNIINTK